MLLASVVVASPRSRLQLLAARGGRWHPERDDTIRGAKYEEELAYQGTSVVVAGEAYGRVCTGAVSRQGLRAVRHAATSQGLVAETPLASLWSCL